MGDWMWWIMTCGISLYFVMLLLDFNKPSKKLMDQIDSQEQRRREMEMRATKLQEDIIQIKSRSEDIDLQMEDLEQRRKDLLPDANKRRMIPIEAGPFPMGSRAEDSPDSERPAHPVHLSAFYIDAYPVTNQDYREFVNCVGYKTPIHWQRGNPPMGLARHPVVNVSWQDAKAYADWMGARLPTEAEWEKASRGSDERLYPWGNRFVEDRCNALGSVGTTVPVDEFALGRSPYNIWDMSGNVYEWCEDFWDESYYQYSPSTNPKGPEGGQERVIRGGFFGETRANVRTTHRNSSPETHTRETIGFRLAHDSDEM
ncbi:MAG: SUMF1/EgtB/PvdO family nonheme iron enzyme [Gemmatimonadetes bacterium]|jgi:formylglycine-generating enzyme required for sulfatase activity|nr:SUMF1/EgtB/PvdO family nonheme iron enzyme [Gemmatimonadota bacterium]MBT5056787.1 SUMF1/EgtB/PvdO family nonheme iron enzyme [Gemmatimonadota bacterium]MBT5143496.1 SUMF1/EgtB/PvdO family nonheme iron enzyme [Gemmatimonadota bacterium]MBT5590187.1 SUMF1/EgtB/PvdO family nonheme iron enzyme [Gemmatimonadota bacterium]MBT5963650.1 SUMF1/EgtB/PvdO family nonheme iron enzyme [Gemmatimonadota bacterium]